MTKYLTLTLLGMSAIGLSACSRFGTQPEPSDPPETLEEARQLWASQNLDNYKFEFQRWCFCAPRQLGATVYVRADTVYRFENLRAENEPIEPEEHQVNPTSFVTIEQLFDQIEGRASVQQAEEVKYDSSMGYPIEAHIGEFAVDAGVSYEIGNVERVTY